jgi:5'-methylthioadenosine phosphorylase
VTVTDILANLTHNAENACNVVAASVASMPETRQCKCGSALKHALITDPKTIPDATRIKLELLVGKYIR